MLSYVILKLDEDRIVHLYSQTQEAIRNFTFHDHGPHYEEKNRIGSL
jgi:hypothetical protein